MCHVSNGHVSNRAKTYEKMMPIVIYTYKK